MDFYILVFKNTLDALKGDEAFKTASVSHVVYPTPPQIIGSCGISMRFQEEALEGVSRLIDSGLSYKALYHITDLGMKEIREGDAE
jgi:hypothetical protein